ncbi:unnamed protein product [Agarophyton chilense]
MAAYSITAFALSPSPLVRSLRPSNNVAYCRSSSSKRSVQYTAQLPRSAAPATPPVATTSVSPRAKQLIEQQIQNPIFDPRLLDNSFGPMFSDLQAQSPPAFVRSSHVPDTTSLAHRFAIDTIAEHSEEAIEAARAYILRVYPRIDQPGGALWPSQRAVACWRDLSAFARVAAYLAICENGLSTRGMHIMQQVYYEMNVPLDAVRTGVHCIREQLADRAAYNNDSEASKIVRTAFDQLLGYLSTF